MKKRRKEGKDMEGRRKNTYEAGKKNKIAFSTEEKGQRNTERLTLNWHRVQRRGKVT